MRKHITGVSKIELSLAHPTIWKFIDGLRRSQKGRDMEYKQMVAGYAPPAKKEVSGC